MALWAKQNVMLEILNFRKVAAIFPFINMNFECTKKFENEAVYIEFIEKTINIQFPDHFLSPEFFELVTTYQVHAHSRTYWKYNKNVCRFSYGWYFTEKTIIAKPLDCKISSDEKKGILTWRNALWKQVETYINNNLNPAKLNVIDQIKDNFTQPLSIKEILDEFETCKDNY